MVDSMMHKLICAIFILLQTRIMDTPMMKTMRGTAVGLITLTSLTMVTACLGHSIARLKRREKLVNTMSSGRVGVYHYPTTLLTAIKEPTTMSITTRTPCTKKLTASRGPTGQMTTKDTLWTSRASQERSTGQKIREEKGLTGMIGRSDADKTAKNHKRRRRRKTRNQTKDRAKSDRNKNHSRSKNANKNDSRRGNKTESRSGRKIRKKSGRTIVSKSVSKKGNRNESKSEKRKGRNKGLRKRMKRIY